ncbi:PIR protein CIR protein [Plasmodium vinckei vinckei]|uniref:PIR protein CIR protein n=1 Tax=Plasmodium vinckei vinckei TaxID=54757 RepID=A0A449BM83_PLAVN|nr:PIR protein CIR protein [Plasmodium vinckei vinckei]VEV54560.1 PIR protein CIR protein [Plasmodium vinckei vinckei]
MEQSSYDIEKVYKEFVTISNYFEGGNNGQLTVNEKYTDLIHNYCHYESNSGDGKCSDYFQMTSSGVIHLLKDLKNKYDLEDDKLAEYGILWLIYKLKQHSDHKLTNLNDFYTDHIVKNKDYDKKINGDDGLTYKEIIDKKKDLMDMNINEIFKLEAPFNILYYLYHEIYDENSFCTEYSDYANNFVDQFKELNNDSNNIEDSSFSQILSTLLNDHNNLINKYGNKCLKFSSIPELSPKKSSVEMSGKDSAQPTALSPEATPSSSSILNTIIPGLSTFSVIPVFLGVAYKTIYKKKIKKSKEENET